jgi:alkanesulfonate monooxygenase SsuD/methylene tetrahydromethanopterin reductase-like flavin-dependent oxidoreductase (luciferase family)
LIAMVQAACDKAGRDINTLELTAGVMVDYPGNNGRPGSADGTPPLTGTPEQMAEALRTYAELGISHIQILLDPNTPASVEAFAPVLELLDA